MNRSSAILSLIAALAPVPALAWGNEGHEIVALIADHYLTPAVKAKVDAMLAADTDTLTAHDIASEATWADAYRDSDRNTTKERYNQTNRWHYVDIEISHPDIDAACSGHPPIPAGETALQGPAQDCVVDKINEFAAELSNPNTSPEERLIALKFVLHFVGDQHQPLHSSDAGDQGGNAKKVEAGGIGSGKLHAFWDTQFVQQLGSDPAEVSKTLIRKITAKSRKAWSKGTPSHWSLEAFAIAKRDSYGALPAPSPDGSYRLGEPYVAKAVTDVSLQLRRAGVRLAYVLNTALGAP